MAKAKNKDLVIVESPAKARTVARFLGDKYVVKASMGHVRDLPRKTMGVDIEKDFEPTYEQVRGRESVIREIKKAAKDAESVYLATDPDREGEAISWHMVEAVGLRQDSSALKRVVFHEITRPAIDEAFNDPRQIDMQLVNAQQARRILDRIVGYKLSPVLWSKVRRGLSAGRVQSVALRLIVDREREVEAFKPVEYWSISVDLSGKAGDSSVPFKANLQKIAGEKGKAQVPNGERASAITADLQVAAYRVSSGKDPRDPAEATAALHYQHSATRGGQAVGIRRAAHDADRAGAVRGNPGRRGRPRGSHHVHEDRLGKRGGERAC